MTSRHREPPAPPLPLAPALAAVALAIVLAAVVVPTATAAGADWVFTVEATYISVYGHDPHVLNVRDAAPGGTAERTTAVTLESDSAVAPRVGARYTRGRWGVGFDFVYFVSEQSVPDQTAASDGSGQVVFGVADRTFASGGPGATLFYGVLEDTELAMWTADLFLTRALSDHDDGALHLLVGVRNADFDNDYRAVVGVQGIGGRRLDASSNYGRMIGPLVGLSYDRRWGRNTVGAYVGQAVVFGEAELSHRAREFAGPLDQAFDVEVEIPGLLSEASFHAAQDVAIPISDLRLDWSYRVSRRFSLGAGIDGSVWWDVPVPPGTDPTAGIDRLRETTIVFFGLNAGVTVTL